MPPTTASIQVKGAGAGAWVIREAARHLLRGESVLIRCQSTEEEKAVRNALEVLTERDLNTKLGVPPASVFGDYTFAQTVGLWLEKGRLPAANLVSPFISTDSFDFSPGEYLELKDRLGLTLRRYHRLPKVSKALEDLNTGFFRYQEVAECKQFITKHLDQYLALGSNLHRDYLLAINSYARACKLAARQERQQQEAYLITLAEDIAKQEKGSGRKAKRALTGLLKRWGAYLEKYHGQSLPPQSLTLSALAKAIEGSLAELYDGRKKGNRELQANALSLSRVTANPRFIDPATLKALEDRLNGLVRQIDEAGLYQLPVGGPQAATTPRQLQLLETVLDRLRNTQRHLGELEDFYARRHFWYAQPARLRRLMAPLLEVSPEEGEAAFSAWYFERCLERIDTPLSALAAPATTKEATLQPGLKLAKSPSLKTILQGEQLPDLKDFALYGIFTQELPEAVPETMRIISIVPPQVQDAHHISLAGALQPSLFLSQYFCPVRPPAWAAVSVDSPPPATEGRLSFQCVDGADWQVFTDWERASSKHLHLYFPQEFTEEERGMLRSEWPYLCMSAPRISLFHAWSSDQITRALLSDGFSVEFLVAALLRAAEAADTAPFDQEALLAIGREIRTRCAIDDPDVHPLMENLLPLLAAKLPRYFMALHEPWRDTFLPLVITAPSGKKTVLLPNGRLPGGGDDRLQELRQQELLVAGFSRLTVNAEQLWMQTSTEVDRIVGAIAGAN